MWNEIKRICLLVKRSKPEWNKIKSEKKIFINNKCHNYINQLFENAKFQDNIKSINREYLRSIIEIPEFYEGVASHKIKELNLIVDKIIQKTLEEIKSKKNSLPNWEEIKNQKIQQAYIEIINKSKTELYSLNINQVTEILIQHVKMLPRFFDFCGENKKKVELLNEIRIIAKNIALEYVQRKNEEIRNKREKEENKYKFRKKEESDSDKGIDSEEEEEEGKESYSDKGIDSEEESYKEKRPKKRKSEEEKYSEEDSDEEEEEEEERDSEEDSEEEGKNNNIEILAKRVINGDFGNGSERRKKLGKKYAAVQNRVNEILGYSKRY